VRPYNDEWIAGGPVCWHTFCHRFLCYNYGGKLSECRQDIGKEVRVMATNPVVVYSTAT